MRKLFFILNPFAGMRKANRYMVDIVSVFNRAGYDVITYVTESRGDAERVAYSRAKEMDIIVCCGGDGTFNETVSGVLRSGTQVPIGYIPAGSTNDFACSLGLPTDVVKAAENIVQGKNVAYDMGKFGQRYFSYVASFGAFTRVSYNTPQNIKNVVGHLAYILEGVQELAQIRKFRVRLEMDDETIEDDFVFGAISNSTSLGGILTLDPKQVDMQDGRFEIMLVRAPRDLVEITECIQALQKQQYNCKMITFRSTNRVKVFASEQMPWTLDGEREDGHACVEVENLHHAIGLIKKG